MRQSRLASVRRVARVAGHLPARPDRSGRRAAARACALVVLSVIALAGCTGPATPAARVAALRDVTAGPRAHPAAGATPPPIDRFRWSARASSPLGAREGPILTWSGGRLLEFGGLVDHGTKATGTGAAFSPATGRWRRAAPVPAAAGVSPGDPSGLSLNPASAWTGRYLAVANGSVRSCPGAARNPASCWTGAALYDPAANHWTRLALPRRLDGLEVAAETWTGRDIVVAAIDAAAAAALPSKPVRFAVAAYTPATRRWRVITPARPRHHLAVVGLDLAYAGGRLLLWSLWDQAGKTKDGFSEHVGVDVLALNSHGAWRNVTGSWPQGQNVPSPVPTRDGILVSPGQIWCGSYCSPPYVSEPGYLANPSTLARKTIPAGPLGRANPAYVWTGNAILAIDLNGSVGGAGTSIHPGDLALFDPAASDWTRLPAVPGHPALSAAPIWTGIQLLVLSNSGRLLAFHR